MSISIDISAGPPDPSPTPRRLTPGFPPSEPNTPIELYNGLATVTQGDVSEELPVRLELTWLPSPGVRFQVTDLPPGFGDTGRGTALQLPDGTRIENRIVTAVNQTVREGEYTARMAGVVNGIVTRGQPTGSAYATFLLPNVDPPIGSGVRYPGRGQAAARTVLNGSGWRMTLDWAEYDRGSIDFLRANSGYAVTMVGRAERDNGSEFSREQASELFGALGWYLSFYAGRWTGPCLVAGHHASGTTVWEEWRCSRVTPFRTRQSWADTLHPPCFFEPFPGFLARWQNAGWAEAVRLAIHWYLEANAQAGSTEGSIVLTQTAFELLAYAVLVDDGGWLSSGGYGNLGAADRTRLIFRWAGIPVTIPTELRALTTDAKAFNWPDIPSAMTEVRNSIAHPTRPNRERFNRHSAGTRQEVWRLGLWALELCLLRPFDYRGEYANRITQRFSGEVGPVPWFVD